ncbi:uncharacterized protein J7T54_004890 [Emericellopsis cladophorae]|uniref:DNA2/NAM7 helicase-like C-terminal domain-containing protein n=1 Tax=Emericellopsis cladophorae TaxID=2686198 RepID=A0A9P9XU78_9HYPO|nr:uncharacterized protein J7T54_004890 [Emericellopsis cladophorae]KAI6777648.1 hypothetical protein J7T54_004890 [Emericellopsis cladophorae]
MNIGLDEASQQIEPSSLVPLVSCSKVILVGDDVQLRPTVKQTALVLDFDVSLTECILRCTTGSGATDRGRAVFIDCEAREALRQASKENKGQADLCVHICKLLTTSVPPLTNHGAAHSIVVLKPYSRQVELLNRMLSRIPQSIEVSSVDGFQRREADVVVFVTVRCNEHRNIGFLTDMRRMNVALTRARTTLIVVGNRATLTEGTAGRKARRCGSGC